MHKLPIYYDKEIDAFYIVLREDKESYFEEIYPNVVIEYNANGVPVGIEILQASSMFRNVMPIEAFEPAYDSSRVHTAHPQPA